MGLVTCPACITMPGAHASVDILAGPWATWCLLTGVTLHFTSSALEEEKLGGDRQYESSPVSAFLFYFCYSVSKHIFLDFDRIKLSAHPLSFSYNQHNLCSCWYISKSLDVPQIIVLDYFPASTTCRSVLSIGQSAAVRVFESVDVSHGRNTHWRAQGDIAATTCESSHQLGLQGPDLCSAEGEWELCSHVPLAIWRWLYSTE